LENSHGKQQLVFFAFEGTQNQKYIHPDRRQKPNEKFQMTPVFVDLDNTLIRTDIAQEMFLSAVFKYPFALPSIFAAALRGSACCKSALCGAVPINASNLPFNDSVLGFIRARKAEGNSIILATAADRSMAQAVAIRKHGEEI